MVHEMRSNAVRADTKTRKRNSIYKSQGKQKMTKNADKPAYPSGERTQVQEIAAWLAKQDNGADSALILAFEKEHAELLSLVKDLKACLLSMTPTEFTDARSCTIGFVHIIA